MNKVTLNVSCLISDSCCFSGTTAVYYGETFLWWQSSEKGFGGDIQAQDRQG